MGTGNALPKKQIMATPPMAVKIGAPSPTASRMITDPPQVTNARSPSGIRPRLHATATAPSASPRPHHDWVPLRIMRMVMTAKPTGMMHWTTHRGMDAKSVSVDVRMAWTNSKLA